MSLKTKTGRGSVEDEKLWVLADERQPEAWQWPIFAYFGKAAEGCKGPCVMRENWNDSFTHWQRIPMATIVKIWETVKPPEPPNVKP